MHRTRQTATALIEIPQPADIATLKKRFRNKLSSAVALFALLAAMDDDALAACAWPAYSPFCDCGDFTSTLSSLKYCPAANPAYIIDPLTGNKVCCTQLLACVDNSTTPPGKKQFNIGCVAPLPVVATPKPTPAPLPGYTDCMDVIRARYDTSVCPVSNPGNVKNPDGSGNDCCSSVKACSNHVDTKLVVSGCVPTLAPPTPGPTGTPGPTAAPSTNPQLDPGISGAMPRYDPRLDR